MSPPTEFRPVAHEFLSNGFHGAAFVGAKAADAFWFYRFDSSFIEVRDIFTCNEKVFASLSTIDIQQRFRHLFKGNEIQIVNVQDAYVGESHTIVFVVREDDEDRDHVFIWNLLTLRLQWLVSPPRLLTAATVTPQQAIMVRHRLVKTWGRQSSSRTFPLRLSTSSLSSSSSFSSPFSPPSSSIPPLITPGSARSSRSSSSSSLLLQKGNHGPAFPTSIDLDLEEEDESTEAGHSSQSKVHIHNNRRQLLVLGHRNGWVTIHKFAVSVTGQVTCNKDPEHEKWLEDGSIISLATLSNKNTGANPVIVAGTSEGKVVIIRYDDSQENNKLEVLMTIKDLHSKSLPITSLTLEPTKDEALDLLAVGQGSGPGVKESKECPAVSIYYLRLQKSDSRLLGYVRPPTVEGEVPTGGSTLATTVSEDSNGRRIHCAFSTHFENAPSQSYLATVQINQNEVPEPDVTSMDDVGGGTLLDISPQTNSYELMVLYLCKLVSYVKAADIESSRLESEWAEGAEGQESARRDMAPLYGTFFQENAKFTYSDSEREEIEQRREQLGGRLFYDRLLEFVDLEVGVLYPPKNHTQQRNLWTNIYFNGNLEADNRNCLAYYLLKNQHGDASERFLREYRIPPKFVDLINGFWALDHFDFKNAVLYLSRPGLTVDWIEDVIEAIALHGSPQLARQFLVAANLDHTSEQFIDTKMKTLTETDFTEAFYYQRSPAVTSRHAPADGQQDLVQDPANRKKRLFTSLLDYCFLDKPNRKGIQALSQLTMNETEEQLFIQYCDGHSGLTREVGQEFLIMYYVNRSRYMEAIRMHRKRLAVEREKDDAEQFHREAIERRNSRQFGDQSKGAPSQRPLNKSQKRQVLIDQLTRVLPAPQRLILELEQEKELKGGSSRVGSTSSARTPLSSHLTFNTGREVQDRGAKAEIVAGSKGILLALLDESDSPSTSLKGLDLDWVARSLTGEADDDETEREAVDEVNGGNDEAMSLDEDAEDKNEVSEPSSHSASKQNTKLSTVDVMELDSD